MPYTADVDTTASKIQKGDHYRVINGNRDYAVLVDTVQVGTKWTTARDAEGALIFRKENDAQVWAMREVPTEEELAAKKIENERKAAEFRLELLTRMHDRMHAMLPNAKEKLIAALQTEGFVSTSLMEDVIYGQAMKNIAVTIDQVLERNENMTILDAMEHLAEGVKEGLINGYNEPTFSGGFSFSNSERQTVITANRKFLQGINWGTL